MDNQTCVNLYGLPTAHENPDFLSIKNNGLAMHSTAGPECPSSESKGERQLARKWKQPVFTIINWSDHSCTFFFFAVRTTFSLKGNSERSPTHAVYFTSLSRAVLKIHKKSRIFKCGA